MEKRSLWIKIVAISMFFLLIAFFVLYRSGVFDGAKDSKTELEEKTDSAAVKENRDIEMMPSSKSGPVIVGPQEEPQQQPEVTPRSEPAVEE